MLSKHVNKSCLYPFFSDIAMRKNLTEIIDIFQSIAVQPKTLVVETHRQNADSSKRLSAAGGVGGGIAVPPHHEYPTRQMATDGKRLTAAGDNHHHLRETWDEIKKLSTERSSSSKDKLVYGVSERRSKRSPADLLGGKSTSAKSGQKSSSSKKHQHSESCGLNISHKLAGGKSSAGHNCDCLPMLEMLGRRIDADRTEIMTSLAERNRVLDTRLAQLETKTRKQIATFNQTMKVSTITKSLYKSTSLSVSE